MNNADEIDKIVLDKLGGYSEEPAPGFFESVMFTREREQRNLKVKRILLIAGAVVLLAVSAYILFKTVFSAQGNSGQNNHLTVIHSSVISEKTGNNGSWLNNQVEAWPDFRQEPDFFDINSSASTPGMLWLTNQNYASAKTDKSNLNTHNNYKATPSVTKNNTTNTSKANSKTPQPSPSHLSNNLRAYFTFKTNTKGEVKFNNESEADEKSTYTWYFGDGKSEDGPDASHQYTQNGIYHTCLTVIDSKGKYDSYCTDLYIENLPVTRNIAGEVNLHNGIPDKGWVYLIRYDSTLMTPFLIDSVKTDETGNFTFKDKPDGYYILRAVLDAKSKHYANYLPTFYGQTLAWNYASRYAIGKDVIVKNSDRVVIDLIPLKGNPGGNNMVDGNSLHEDDLLVIYDEKGNPIAYTYSDKYGHFAFGNLPPGNYKVFNPATGKFSSYVSYGSAPIPPDNPEPPANSQNPPGDNGGTIGNSTLLTKDFTISPNPCKTFTTIRFDNTELTRAKVSIINMNNNMEMFTYTVKNPSLKQEVTVDVQYWAPGLYYVVIDKGNGNILSSKLLKAE